MILALIAAVVGQQQCGVRPAYQARTYAAPVYQAQTYQAQTYDYAVQNHFVAAVPYVDHVAVAGDYYRAEKADAARQAEIKEQRENVAKLAGMVDQLRQMQQATLVQQTVATTTRQYGAPEYGPVTGSPQQPPRQFQAPPPPPVQYQPPLPSKGDPSPPRGGDFPAPAPPVPAAPPQPNPPASPVLGSGGSLVSETLVRRCSGCHTGTSSRKGFAIFSEPGRLAALDPAGLDKINTRVFGHDADMPPSGPMQPSEYGELMTWLVSAQAPPRAPAPTYMTSRAERNPF